MADIDDILEALGQMKVVTFAELVEQWNALPIEERRETVGRLLEIPAVGEDVEDIQFELVGPNDVVVNMKKRGSVDQVEFPAVPARGGLTISLRPPS